MASIHNHKMPRELWEGEDQLATLKRNSSVPIGVLIRNTLGDRFVDIIMGETKRSTRIVLGEEAGVSDAGDNLWLSPSEQLLGNSKLTRRHTNHVLTHETILRFGEKIAQEFERNLVNKLETEGAGAINKMREELQAEADRKAAQTRALQHEAYISRLASIRAQLNKQYSEQMYNLKCRLMQEADKRVKNAVKQSNAANEERTKHLLSISEQALKQRFNFQLKWATADIYEDYVNKLNHEMKKLILNHEEETKKLKAKAGQKEIIRVTEPSSQMIAAKKRIQKLKASKKKLIEKARVKQGNLEKRLLLSKHALRKTIDSNRRLREQNRNCRCISKQLLKYYQKFVDYHLKTPQDQKNEFLLSPEKIMGQFKPKKQQKKTSVVKPICEEIEIKAEMGEETEMEHLSLTSLEICNKEVASLMRSLIRRALPSDMQVETKKKSCLVKVVNGRKCLVPDTASQTVALLEGGSKERKSSSKPKNSYRRSYRSSEAYK